MMSDDIVIRAERLGKKYVIGHRAERERYIALRDVLVRGVRNAWRKTADMVHSRALVAGDTVEEFWALKDVNFEVRRGEVLGIVGRNGAGKSTLLKILSRITEPSEGRVTIDGRVASLLEVGTGFHPELTGRENIYLNGAILGMTRAEIRLKFDEIVAFADIERFLDTPVKRYSNGMYVRLAFSVAAHLEPEILVVDEVLAVGDFEFQKKCLRKMHDVSSKLRRTVLFVSHNLAAVQSLCNKALLMSEGRSTGVGEVEPILHTYLANINREVASPLDRRTDREGSGDVRFVSVSLEGAHGRLVSAFQCGAVAALSFTIDNCTGRNLRNVNISIGIDNELAQRVVLLDSEMIGASIDTFPLGRQNVCITMPRMALMPGRYHLTLFAAVNGVVADWLRRALTIDVEQGQFFRTGHLPPLGQAMFLIDHRLDHREDNGKSHARCDGLGSGSEC